MGKIIVICNDVRVASEVTFIPGAEVKRNHAIVTAIANLGINDKAGNPLTTDVTLNFWGKYAGVAACFLYPGKQINCEGELRSYTVDTGRVNSAGKRELIRKNEVVVRNMQLLGDSLKEINKRIATNIGAMKAAGQLPQTVVLSAEQLLANPDKTGLVDFNPTVAAQTGRYGKAKVWSKDRGFWEASKAPTAPVSTIDQVTQLKAEIERLQKIMGSTTAPTTTAEVVEVIPETAPAAEIALFADAE